MGNPRIKSQYVQIVKIKNQIKLKGEMNNGTNYSKQQNNQLIRNDN